MFVGPGFGSETEYHSLETDVFAQPPPLSGLKSHCLTNVSVDRKKVSWEGKPDKAEGSRLRSKGFVRPTDAPLPPFPCGIQTVLLFQFQSGFLPYFFSFLKLAISHTWKKLKPLYFSSEVIFQSKRKKHNYQITEMELQNCKLEGACEMVPEKGGPETGKLCSRWSRG